MHTQPRAEATVWRSLVVPSMLHRGKGKRQASIPHFAPFPINPVSLPFRWAEHAFHPESSIPVGTINPLHGHSSIRTTFASLHPSNRYRDGRSPYHFIILTVLISFKLGIRMHILITIFLLGSCVDTPPIKFPPVFNSFSGVDWEHDHDWRGFSKRLGIYILRRWFISWLVPGRQPAWASFIASTGTR